MSRAAGIRYVSLADSTGYGIAARRYLKGLLRAGVPLTWTPMVAGRSWGMGYEPGEVKSTRTPELDSVCNLEIPYDTVLLHLVPEYYPRWIQREPGKRILGYTVWETDRIPHHWLPLLNAVDGLMVPCRWNKDVFEKCGVTTPIWVVPHIAGGVPPASGSEERWGIEPGDFVFYTINVWSERKQNGKVIEAYLRAFRSGDPVVLVVKTSLRDDTKFRPGPVWRYLISLTIDSTRRRVNAIRRKFSNPARIMLIPRHLTDQDMRYIHRRGNCYVSLTRGEGWGLGAFDAAAAGKPVIMTGYGGQLDYLPPDRAFLVDYDLVPVETHLSSYTPDQHWAEPNVDHAARRMREVFSDQAEARKRGRRLQAYVLQNFDESAVIQNLRAVLRRE